MIRVVICGNLIFMILNLSHGKCQVIQVLLFMILSQSYVLTLTLVSAQSLSNLPSVVGIFFSRLFSSSFWTFLPISSLIVIDISKGAAQKAIIVYELSMYCLCIVYVLSLYCLCIVYGSAFHLPTTLSPPFALHFLPPLLFRQRSRRVR